MMMNIMAISFPKALRSLEILGAACSRFMRNHHIYSFHRAILQSPQDYPHPEIFNPSRYLTPKGTLDPSVRDPGTACFGFGRRSCPGKHIATASLFAMVSTLLATVEVVRAKDAEGNEIVPVVDVTDGVLSHPKPFPWAVRPRSQHAEELLSHALTTD
jgi:cytochrome P450